MSTLLDGTEFSPAEMAAYMHTLIDRARQRLQSYPDAAFKSLRYFVEVGMAQYYGRPTGIQVCPICHGAVQLKVTGTQTTKYHCSVCRRDVEPVLIGGSDDESHKHGESSEVAGGGGGDSGVQASADRGREGRPDGDDVFGDG